MTPAVKYPQPRHLMPPTGGGRRLWIESSDGRGRRLCFALTRRPSGAPGEDRRPTTGTRSMTRALGPRRRGRAWVLLGLLVLLLVGLVAGCEGLVEGVGGGGGGRAPADLETRAAERAAWPDPPKDAVAGRGQRGVGGG